MDADSRELITWILGTTLSLSIIMGLVVRYILIPYLRDHLVAPMKQVEKQVSENHHSNLKPTVLDRIDDVQKAVEDLRGDFHTMAGMYEGHITWSDRWVGLIERELDHAKELIHNHNHNHKP